MPAEALPVEPTRSSLPGTVRLRREYRDPLGRPLRGAVTISGGARVTSGHMVAVPAPVTVELVDGVLDVPLPPGTYQLAAAMRTVDGDRTSDTDTAVVE